MNAKPHWASQLVWKLIGWRYITAISIKQYASHTHNTCVYGRAWHKVCGDKALCPQAVVCTQLAWVRHPFVYTKHYVMILIDLATPYGKWFRAILVQVMTCKLFRPKTSPEQMLIKHVWPGTVRSQCFSSHGTEIVLRGCSGRLSNCSWTIYTKSMNSISSLTRSNISLY